MRVCASIDVCTALTAAKALQTSCDAGLTQSFCTFFASALGWFDDCLQCFPLKAALRRPSDSTGHSRRCLQSCIPFCLQPPDRSLVSLGTACQSVLCGPRVCRMYTQRTMCGRTMCERTVCVLLQMLQLVQLPLHQSGQTRTPMHCCTGVGQHANPWPCCAHYWADKQW